MPKDCSRKYVHILNISEPHPGITELCFEITKYGNNKNQSNIWKQLLVEDGWGNPPVLHCNTRNGSQQ